MNKNFPLETRYSTLKMYRENYENDLKLYLESYEDNTQIDFLEIDLLSHKEFLKYLLTKTPVTNEIDEGSLNQRKINSQKRIIDFIENKINTINCNITDSQSTLSWHGDKTEFLELIKALIVNGNIDINKNSQKETITVLSKIFNIEIKNPDQTLTKLKTRNNGSETLFLDKLQKSLFDYITREKKKNTRY